jgi:hypothetical protein
VNPAAEELRTAEQLRTDVGRVQLEDELAGSDRGGNGVGGGDPPSSPPAPGRGRGYGGGGPAWAWLMLAGALVLLSFIAGMALGERQRRARERVRA